MKLAALGDREAFAGGRFDLVGGDPTGLSAEPTAVWADDLDAVRDHPDRLPGAATAFASAFLAMFICQRPTLLDVLTRGLGDDDLLVDTATLEAHARGGQAGRPTRSTVRDICSRSRVLTPMWAVVADWLARTGVQHA